MTKLKLFQSLCVVLIFCSTAFGQGIGQKLDSLLTSHLKKREFSGNVLISENGKVTFEKSYGFANEVKKIPLNKNSLFDVASITKEFTATAIVMLQERGKISYDDKIIKYIPELSQYKNVSISNLLNHTSGIGDLDNLLDTLFAKEFKGLKSLTNSDMIEVLAKYKPAVKSDILEQYEYSNIGYQLLGTVIEKVSGQTYAAFIRKNIFEPLKMKNSFVYGENMKSTPLAEGHYYDDSLKTVEIANTILDYSRFRITENILGGRGIYTTANDLLIWINNFTKNKLITPESFALMTTRATLKDSSKTDYGFGYELGFWKDYSPTISHSGRWPGYSTIFEYNPTNKKVVILLRNFNYPSHLSKINNILYGIQPLIFINLSKQETDKFVGDYKNPTGSIKKIVSENGKIYAQMNPSVKLELKPISKSKFVIIGYSPEVQYEFIEENGKVTKYISRQPEMGVLKEAIRL